MRSKTWFLLAVCLLAVLGIGLWTRGAKKEVQKEALPEVAVIPQVETIEEPPQAVATEALPREPSKEPAQVIDVIILDEPAEVKEEIIEETPQGLVTIYGPVTSMDPCLQTITVDGTTVDVSSYGNFPMYRTYQVGDVVEVTYRETGSGNVLHSIETLQER
jgi:hypothetical protein